VSPGASIATGLFTSAAAGILATLLLAPFGDLRRLFFAVNGGLALGLLALAASLRRLPLPGQGRPGPAGWGAGDWAGAATALAIALVISYLAALHLPGGREGRAILGMTTGAAVAATALDGWVTARQGEPAWIFGAGALAAAALLGLAIVTMVMGHWYLVRWRLPAGHLVRFSRLLAGAIGARAATLAAGVLILGAGSPQGLGGFVRGLAVDRGFFFWQRVFFGILGPAVFAYMVHETARIRSTQSATGILYIAVLFVLIGEFLARYLAVAGAGPL
jgi:hypothetical protein